jgi:putative ATP-dependent endonuclease of the OLD family
VLRKVLIKNYRAFKDFKLEFSRGVNIIVGSNDAGKSTLLEAINLALTARLHGYPISAELSPHLFNQETTAQYVRDLRSGRKPEPPEIVIEVSLEDAPQHAELVGSNNLLGVDGPGVRLKIVLDEDFSERYQGYIADPENVTLVPTEYYTWVWLDFGGNLIKNTRHLPDASLIDASAIRLQNGTDHYMQQIIDRHLETAERVELSRSYRSLRETFADIDAIGGINTKLAASEGALSDRRLSLSIDVSPRAAWERTLVPHLDDLPFHLVGKGEQSTLKIMLALAKKADDSHVILVEEPENHLSFSSLNMIMDKIARACVGKQVLVTTHSSFVLNKLGLGNLILLTPAGGVRITDLPPDTVDYFKKLPGFDTLRLVLAGRVILVEGPSDELVVQRAYRDAHDGRLPLQDGVDVMSMDGLSAKRFLDVAVRLEKPVVVVNDNDGDEAAIRARYGAYGECSFIRICIGKGSPETLEPQLLAANDRETLNQVLGKNYDTDDKLLAYMKSEKTTCALAIFESAQSITTPEYIRDAIA